MAIDVCFTVRTLRRMRIKEQSHPSESGLKKTKEGEISLTAFLEMCAEDGVEPRKHFSGKFNLRVTPALHQRLAAQAAAHGKSINAWIIELLSECAAHGH